MSSDWKSKSTFLHKVTGNEIIQEHDKINCSDNMFVVATQPIPWDESKTLEGDKVRLYDAFIYYKVRSKIGNIVIPEEALNKNDSGHK